MKKDASTEREVMECKLSSYSAGPLPPICEINPMQEKGIDPLTYL
jgi:hypothetical protein